MPENNSYLVPSKTVIAEQKIKKSRFIATVGRASGKKEAEMFIDEISARHPGASHNCYAFIAGNPGGRADTGMGDDGEVPGTAAKPMMNVLQHKKIGNIVAVVTRYFGGTKLGHGGLIRAYTSSLQLALDKLRLEKTAPLLSVTISTDYASESSVRSVLKKMKVSVSKVEHAGALLLHLKAPRETALEIQKQVMNVTRGRAGIKLS